MKTENVKGFRDLTGKEAAKKEETRKILTEVFEKYGFEPAETPEIESEEFVRGDNPQDGAVSDVFRLKDRGKRRLALRYEFTFQLKRLAKNKKLPYRRYQIGSVFRDEPSSSGRFRQFTQADADVVGSSAKDEAEMLSMTRDALKKLGINHVIYFSNRKLLNEILEKEKIKNVIQVIRELDKTDKLPEEEIKNNLKKLGAENVLELMKKREDFFKKYESFAEIEELKKYCGFHDVMPTFLPSLARGLSYYDGTVFEIKIPKVRETICAGGSYKINGIQATGISFGIDRIIKAAKIESVTKKTLVISIDRDRESIELARKLRQGGKNVVVCYGRPSKAMEYADSCGFQEVVFVGEKETSEGKFKIRNMDTGREEFFKL